MKAFLIATALLITPAAFAAGGYPPEAHQAIVKSCNYSCSPQATKFKLKAGACKNYCACYSSQLPNYLTNSDLVDIGSRAKANKNPSDAQMTKITKAAQACQSKLIK